MTIMNENNFIANRLMGKDMLVGNTTSICGKNRSFFGINWCDVIPKCSHTNHDSKYRPLASGCRQFNFDDCSRTEVFLIDGR